jgi:hypothetical protein
MITLTVGYDDEIALWFFAVKEDENVLHFRHGFRSCDEAAQTGDAWIRDELGLSPR